MPLGKGETVSLQGPFEFRDFYQFLVHKNVCNCLEGALVGVWLK